MGLRLVLSLLCTKGGPAAQYIVLLLSVRQETRETDTPSDMTDIPNRSWNQVGLSPVKLGPSASRFLWALVSGELTTN